VGHKTIPQIILLSKGGVVRRFTQSEEVGQVQHSESLNNSGGCSKHFGVVYSDGPRNVYHQLTNGPINNSPILQRVNHSTRQKTMTRIHPIPASVRKQQKIINKFHLCPTASLLAPQNKPQSTKSGKEGSTQGLSDGVTRNPPDQRNRKKQQDGSLSSAGEILRCSSINSTDIRNCNKRITDNLNHDAAQKVWKGAIELGVVGDEGDDVYVKRILTNENQEDVTRRQREHPPHRLP
jgi:hypothetical protein